VTTQSPTEMSDLREQLRALGLRATGARLAVLRLLGGQGSPTSHPEIADALAEDGWDRATLYRNLVDLTRVGLLRRVDHGDHVWRYELARAEGHDEGSHPHFLCTVCGDLACLPALTLQLPVADLPAALREGRVSIQFRGTCDRCVDP
jgi:Fur family transcriptional regulator, ferric uptake regulator